MSVDKTFQASGTWSAWTPTVTSETGTLTTASGSGRWMVVGGRTVHYNATITVTTAGTGSNGLRFTLPNTPAGGSDYIGNGRESQSTGVALTVMNIGGGSAQIMRYDNATVIASGRTCRISGTYELG